MKTKIIPSRWLQETRRRLDPGPYLSGSIEAREILKRLARPKESLIQLTKGHDGGIYNGPQFSRNYVSSPPHGVPFLGSSSMLVADLAHVPFLRKQDAYSGKLRHLELRKGTTLISCSGTIGRMVYTRSDMEGMWSSQHIMKVVPNPERVPPGYLYTFLNSCFGIPLITSGTYGAIIQHIEPEHIRDIPVPRLGEKLELQVNDLVEESSRLRTHYRSLMSAATREVFSSCGFQDVSPSEWSKSGPDLGFEVPKAWTGSLRALNFNPRFESLCARIRTVEHKELEQLCVSGTLHRGGRYKRVDAAPEFGVELIGQKQLFWLRTDGRFLARRFLSPEVYVEPGCVLIAAQGTLGENELFCRAEFVTRPMARKAYSEHLLRVLGDEAVVERGYLFAFCRSETMFRLLRSISMGTKLQDHHPTLLRRLPIPYPAQRIRLTIDSTVREAADSRDKALCLENEAIGAVERAVAGES
jgi:hypothetical protein